MKIHIRHPAPSSEEPSVPSSFAAFGLPHDNNPATFIATLTKDGAAPIIGLPPAFPAPATPYKLWIRLFPQVPAGGLYLLTVTDAVAGTSAELPVLVAAGAVAGPIAAGPITTTWPPNNANLCNNFAAYGTSTAPAGTTVSGVMDNGDNQISAGPVTPQNGLWVLEFDNVPNGSGYTLSVQDSAGNHAVNVNGLNVSNTFCKHSGG
jgi:hypothetical protein